MITRTPPGAEGTVAPAWLTVNVRPATVSVPLRAVVDLLAATVKDTDAGPLPEVGVTTTQLTVLDADQVHPPAVDTGTEPVPPAADTLADELPSV